MVEFLRDNYNYYADCPIVRVQVWRHDARSNACPVCAAMDGECYVTDDDRDEPYDIKQHRHCRCKWKRQGVNGLLQSDIESLKSKHEEITKELSDAEGQVAFREHDIEEYTAKAEEYEATENEQNQLAERLNSEAEALLTEAEEIRNSTDELTEEQQDWIDELLLEAASKLEDAQEALDKADAAHDDYAEALREVHQNEDELDAAKKKVVIWTAELLKVEPCLEWPSIEDAVHEVAGAGAHYMM